MTSCLESLGLDAPHRLPEPSSVEPQKSKTCKYCGCTIDQGAWYCSRCGKESRDSLVLANRLHSPQSPTIAKASVEKSPSQTRWVLVWVSLVVLFGIASLFQPQPKSQSNTTNQELQKLSPNNFPEFEGIAASKELLKEITDLRITFPWTSPPSKIRVLKCVSLEA